MPKGNTDSPQRTQRTRRRKHRGLTSVSSLCSLWRVSLSSVLLIFLLLIIRRLTRARRLGSAAFQGGVPFLAAFLFFLAVFFDEGFALLSLGPHDFFAERFG